MKDNLMKAFYNTVLSQTLSTCGQFLFAGNNFGDIFVLCIGGLQKINDDYTSKNSIRKNPLEPVQVLHVGEFPVNSLEFHRDFLIVGTVGRVTGYKWDDDKFQLGKIGWDVQIPALPESVESTDVNCMWLENDSEHLYIGCGDNNIYVISLEDGKIIRNLQGHKDFIHCLAMWDNVLYSASEDGRILFWNLRDEKSLARIEPYKQKNLMRPECGKWQGTVSVMNDWLVCGGGPRSSMWHLRSMECTNVLRFPGKAHCSGFVDDLIFVAGEHNFLHQYSFNGDISAEIPLSGAAAYSLVWQNEPLKFLSIGGASNVMDICTNFNYKDVVVKLYKTGK